MTMPPSDMLCFALYSAGHAMQSAYAPLLEPLGLTYPQYLVLSSLSGRADQTVGQLGATLQLDSNTLTPLLKRMETAGWLTRQRSTLDERQVLVALTAAGRDLVVQAAGIPECFLQTTGLTLPEVTALRDSLTRLRVHMRPRPDKRQDRI